MNSLFTDTCMCIHTYLSICLYWWEYFLVKNQTSNLPCCGAIEISCRIYLFILKLSLKVGQLCWFHSRLELLTSLGSPNSWLPCQLIFCSADLLAGKLASLCSEGPQTLEHPHTQDAYKTSCQKWNCISATNVDILGGSKIKYLRTVSICKGGIWDLDFVPIQFYVVMCILCVLFSDSKPLFKFLFRLCF